MPLVLPLALALAAATDPTHATPMEPADAIALARTHHGAGGDGTFAMTPVSAERISTGVFIHSTADYRRPDDLTIKMSLPVAREFAKKWGSAPETLLIGKHIVVTGHVLDQAIVNSRFGAATGLNRMQHVVRIDRIDQIVSVG